MYEWDFYDNLPNYHPIADANNLSDGFYAARKGSHWKAQIQRFRWNELSEIRKLQIELDNYANDRPDSYELSKYSEFTVNENELGVVKVGEENILCNATPPEYFSLKSKERPGHACSQLAAPVLLNPLNTAFSAS